MSERPISEALREFNDASYPGTNWPELMARAPELLAIVEAAKVTVHRFHTNHEERWEALYQLGQAIAAGEEPTR